jgi:fructoselysine-6-P-deglycase FrlB-like protein
MTENGKMVIFVDSSPAPARTIQFSSPMFSTTGVMLGVRTRTGVVFQRSDGEARRLAVREAKGLACRLGMELEVIDRARSGLIRRLASAIVAVV